MKFDESDAIKIAIWAGMTEEEAKKMFLDRQKKVIFSITVQDS